MADKDTLIARGKALGIDADGRWSEDRLNKEIAAAEKKHGAEALPEGVDYREYPAGQDERSDKARAEEAQRAGYHPPANRTVPEAQAGDAGNKPPKGEAAAFDNRSHFPVRLKKGYFPEDGGPKMEKDTVVEVRIGEAKRMIDAGIAERADAFPVE